MASNKQNKTTGIILLIIAVVCGLILLNRVAGDYIATPEVIYPIALILMFAGGIWGAFRSNPGQFLRIVLGWMMVFMAIMFSYTIYHDYKNSQLAKQTEGLTPDYVIQKQGSHFYTDALVNGVQVAFMIDSGASMVVLTKESAIKAGIDVDAINEHVMTSTANGAKLLKAAYVKEIRLGDIVVENLRVAVSEKGLKDNLLGTDFMKHVSKKVEVGKELRLWK
ncbi:MAG: TIGR02281 family clan AA aspartic protease [Alphaproteobacteria bacterium]